LLKEVTVTARSATATALGLFAVLAGLAVAWSPVTKSPERFDVSAHPVAVLAWAKANCYDELTLRADAPKTHPEILLQVSGSHDAAKSKRQIAALCAEAMAIAKPVVNAATLPDATGAGPLYDRFATAAR
jgi:hypothetical protein